MEYRADGRMKSEKQLNTSFTIPKKKQKLEVCQDVAIEAKSVVNDVPEMESVKPSYVDPYSNILAEIKSTPPIDRSKIEIMVNMKETPHTATSNYINYKEKVGGKDDTFPKELNDQLEPLFCKLCNAQLGSIINAKLHYDSPKHEKKVVQFLIAHAASTQQPVHEFVDQANSRKRKADEDNNPLYYHCNVCDIRLTSKIHAQSHYAGKNHLKMLTGRKHPTKGHFNEDGKFVRRLDNGKSTKHKDGFGLDFEKSPSTSSSTETATSLRCEICKILVTSLPQMKDHLDGQKHKKKLRQTGIVVECTTPTSACFASCKTPSGRFYCRPCDLCFISERQFSSHLETKKHFQNCNMNKD